MPDGPRAKRELACRLLGREAPETTGLWRVATNPGTGSGGPSRSRRVARAQYPRRRASVSYLMRSLRLASRAEMIRMVSPLAVNTTTSSAPLSDPSDHPFAHFALRMAGIRFDQARGVIEDRCSRLERHAVLERVVLSLAPIPSESRWVVIQSMSAQRPRRKCRGRHSPPAYWPITAMPTLLGSPHTPAGPRGGTR